MYMQSLFCLVIFLSIAACQKSTKQSLDQPQFEKIPQGFVVTDASVNEASGIADSKLNDGNLWVEEDSGNPPQLYLLSHNGTVNKRIYIKDAVNRDWEDIALSTGPENNKDYLYIGDIGDNDQKYATYTFYRFQEPVMTEDTVRVFDKINFSYPDGSHDAEAFLVDRDTKDIYVITKRDTKSRLYKISYPQSTASMNDAVFLQELSYSGVVSAAMSMDGKEIIIKTYTDLYYYSKKTGEDILQALQKESVLLDYQIEPQGEAVSFAVKNTGFFTLSERISGGPLNLYFYKRN